MYELYSNRFSGHSYKVALFLEMAGVSWRRIDVALSVPRPQRDVHFRRDSRFQEVPVLIDGEERICQSNQILSYLGDTLGKMVGASASERLRIGEWLFWESNRIGFSIANLRFYKRFEPSIPADLEGFLMARATADLDVLDAALSGQAFLTGDNLTIADLSCSAYLFWADEAGIAMENWPNIAAWLKRIARQPGWSRPEDLLTRAS